MLELNATRDWPASVEKLGFAIIPNAFTLDQIGALTEALQSSSLHRTRAGIRHALKHSAINSVAHNSELVKIATDILGSNAFPFRATVFEKSIAANWLVVWHQDTALPLRDRREALGWGPWSLKEGVNYAHARASALAHILHFAYTSMTQLWRTGRSGSCPVPTIVAF